MKAGSACRPSSAGRERFPRAVSAPSWRRRWTCCRRWRSSPGPSCHETAPWTARTSGLCSPRQRRSSPHKLFCYYLDNQLQAVRSGQWKLLLEQHEYPSLTTIMYTNRLQVMQKHFPLREKPSLYDLETDVGEKQDVAAAASGRGQAPDQAGAGLRPPAAVGQTAGSKPCPLIHVEAAKGLPRALVPIPSFSGFRNRLLRQSHTL